MANDTKGIFISYRRDESAGYAGRIADRFVEHFGEDRVFRDIDSIEPGLDFAEAIERAVGSSEVLIAVIGKNWLTATDAAGRKRLENTDDYVRMEIAAALKRNIRVIPVLVQGASMPSADELSDDLAPLTRRNAFELHDSSWTAEVQRLITTLDKVLGRRPVDRDRELEPEIEQLRIEPGQERSRGFLRRLFGLQPRPLDDQTPRIVPWMIWVAVLLGVALVWVALWLLGFLSEF